MSGPPVALFNESAAFARFVHAVEATSAHSVISPNNTAGLGGTLRSDLRKSLADGGFFSVMLGLGETYFAAFVLALGGTAIAAGLVTAIPLLAGAILQLATPWAVREVTTHKRWIVLTAACQAASLLLMPLAAYLGERGVPIVFLAATLYWGAGLAAGPVWNTWIEGVVPRRIRTKFFARRVRISQACVLVGFVLGGVVLQYGRATGQTLLLFSAIFLAASICRFLSALMLARQSNQGPKRVFERYVTIRELFSGPQSASSKRLLLYLFGVQSAVFIAGPYFAPFMLTHMEMSYQTFALLLGLSFVGKLVALPFWGRVAQVAGAHRLLWIGGVSIVPIAGLWMVSRSLPFLAVLQIAGGATWAAYELAMLLMFFETIPRHERTSVLTLYNFGNAAAQLVGALLGALWLKAIGGGPTAYLSLFVVSSIARGMTILLLARVSKKAIAPEVVRANEASVEPELPAAPAVDVLPAPALALAGTEGGEETFDLPSPGLRAPRGASLAIRERSGVSA